MQKPIIHIYCVIAACLCLTVSAWWPNHAPAHAADGSGVPVVSAGMPEEPEGAIIVLEFSKDERLVQVEEQYAAAISAKAAEAEATRDAAESERLQKEIHQLKAETELATKEVMLDMAIEDEDEERIAQLQDDLEALYNPQHAQPDHSGAVQAPGGQGTRTASHAKNPDDQ